ncbi:hypothetical protein [Agrococcus carbonis]|uniref:DNA modification methylase n=1 Tax=Agrococcus carbonis TaxID=684552 RepID=A0A1H1R7H2_9MICO|nr:hypothetical protein [Agrococcus carbonis]SDS31668.1 hypothetical protein SAMN04489719_2040 [Agrococcus carbonis]
MQPRLAAAAAAAVVVTIAATGCNILTPQATQIEYDASDGVSGTTGTVTMHNAMLIGEPDGSELNLAVTFTNEGEATFVEVRVEDESQDVRVPAGVTTFGFPDQQLIFETPSEFTYGKLQNVSFAADGAEPVGLGVPTISTEVVGYESYAPAAE